MKLSHDEINEELASLAGIIRILRRRRAELQRQAAVSGRSVDPAVRIEIEDITAQLREHEAEVARLETLAAEGDQPLAEVEYRVQVAEAWDTPEGHPTVAGAARLELTRLRLGVSPERAAAIEHEVRVALVQQALTGLDIGVLLGTSETTPPTSPVGAMNVYFSPTEGGTVTIERFYMEQKVVQADAQTVALRVVGRAVRLDAATAVQLLIVCLPSEPKLAVATFGPQLLTINQVAIRADERTMFEQFIADLAQALGQPDTQPEE